MDGLLVAFGAFVALHSVPALPPVRSRLVEAMGRRAYLAVYSLVSTALLAWVFYAALATDYVELWEPQAWQGWLTFIAAPIGLFFVIAGLLAVNPLSISLRAGDVPQGSVLAITRHPVLWGFLCWSLGHIPPNGDLRAVILFGGFALFSVGGLVMLDRRAKRRFGSQWSLLAAPTGNIPFSALIAGNARFSVDRAMIMAILLTAISVLWLLADGHSILFGADPVAFATSG